MSTTSVPMPSALDAQINNIRNNIPPQFRQACCPDSMSTFLRNVLFTMGILNVLFLMTSLLVAGVRFMGLSIMFIAFISCTHIIVLTLVLGNHIADTMSRLNLVPLANTLRSTSSRYATDLYMHGTLFGSTAIMAILLHITSSYFGELANCVADNAASSISSGQHNLTGGYASHVVNTNTYNIDNYNPYNSCGSSGPVGFISFITGLLFWFNSILSIALYARRDEILSGGGGGSQQYDEIGSGDGTTFAGDFPSSQGMRTMQV